MRERWSAMLGATALVLPEVGAAREALARDDFLGRLALPGGETDTMPPSAPLHLSISELARRFSVSRAHVLRLLRQATAHGLITRGTGGEDTITFTPALA